MKVPAAVVGTALESIREANAGALDPHHVVEAARAKTHPLHSHFEWDNTRAAEAHRLYQAGYLIRAVVIIREEAPAEMVRAFVSITDEESGSRTYTSLSDAMGNEDSRMQLLQRAEREALAWAKRYRSLASSVEWVRAVVGAIEAEPAPKRKRKRA